MHKLPLTLLLVSVLALAACAPRVYVERDNTANLSGLHTFAWVSPPIGPVANPILDSQILEERVQRAVVADLTARGFTQVAANQSPDFTVTYHTVSKQKLESSGASFAIGFGGYYPYGFGNVVVPVGSNVQSREEGTLMLDIIDARSKRLVWRGWTKDWISLDNYSEQAVAEDVHKILAKFPGTPSM
ncbi:MAG: DUF4136 domain-containing protein [Gammaproteobacteria bacterium]|nr:DUF4136 domain-containing protein [Gammaproteobacteria bacterium]MBU6510631.1 DUF4136 domain-containing protein [Gammaproteobacteria bacterium]MDE1983851.1 DUF4136 domain-containing protein [Gammaproteobacteria bacterium]MDE2107983.1 DUF4136 domain-containing protein [Gammaproteobacteria bacterium]MDE2461811.1 DUF4136 domain-containing protein [Gammaproteobacteria bacterium]